MITRHCDVYIRVKVAYPPSVVSAEDVHNHIVEALEGMTISELSTVEGIEAIEIDGVEWVDVK